MYKIKGQVSMNNEQKMKTETDLLNLSALMTGLYRWGIDAF